MAILCLGLCLGFPAPAPATEQPRTWTDVQGREVKATFLSLTDGKVELRLANGSLSTVALERLAPADRQYAAERAKAATTPKTPTTPDAASAPPPAWPGDIALSGVPEVKTIKEDPATNEFIYETENYEFRCDAKLGTSVVREFARIFEATVLLNSKLPLDLQPKPESGRTKYQALLFKNKEDYFAAGATPGSAGVYMGSKDCLMVPMDNLGVRAVGKRYSLDRAVDNTTLIHEITHQVMNRWLSKLPTWYIEGSAEYVSAAKYRLGRFSFARMGDNIVEYLRQSKGVWEKKWTMWHVYHLMQIDGGAWSGGISGANSAVSIRNYGSSALLTYYFYHIDDQGDGRHFINYINDIRAGTLERLAAQRHLIRGRAYADIEKEIAQRMRRYGLDLDFTGEAGPAPESAAADSSKKTSE